MRARNFALATGGAYAAGCLLLFLQQTRLLYRPQRTAKGHEDNLVALLPRQGALPALSGWVDNPMQGRALLYCGGSSESVEERRDSMAQAFPMHTRYIVPYRGFGPNSSSKPFEQGLKDDGLRLFELLKRNHSHVDIIGRSLGTSIALHVAARMPVNKLTLITPFDSIRAVAQKQYKIVPVGRILRDHHEAWKDACNIKMKALVCLAGRDTVTPRVCWERLAKHFVASPEVFEDQQADHTTISQSISMWDRIGEFLRPPEPGLALSTVSASLSIPEIRRPGLRG
jgi:hypothetical protein